MSSACWMTRSRSFSSEMDRQLERIFCSSPQFMGLLKVKRTGQSNTAKRPSCRAVGHMNSYIQIHLTKGPQKHTHAFFHGWRSTLPFIVQILTVVFDHRTFSLLPLSFIKPCDLFLKKKVTKVLPDCRCFGHPLCLLKMWCPGAFDRFCNV